MKMVKVFVLMAALTLGALMTTSCGTPLPLGCLYTQVTVPVTVGTGDIFQTKKGTAECYSFLGWFAGGNASINAAARNGNIRHVAWANQEIVNVLGIYGIYRTVVYGRGEFNDPEIKALVDSVDAANK